MFENALLDVYVDMCKTVSVSYIINLLCNVFFVFSKITTVTRFLKTT